MVFVCCTKFRHTILCDVCMYELRIYVSLNLQRLIEDERFENIVGKHEKDYKIKWDWFYISVNADAYVIDTTIISINICFISYLNIESIY